MASKTYNDKKTYLCHKCNHVFEAEDSLNLTCPKCGSDNIDEKNKKNGMLLPKVLVFLAAVAVGYFVTDILVTEEEQTLPVLPDAPIASITPDSIDSDTARVVEVVDPVAVVKPIKIECTASPVNVDNRYVYSFKVSSDYDGKKKIEYHLLKSAEATEPFMTSTNGQFNEVPPADEAFYWVYAIVKDENRMSDTIRIEGLKKRPVEVRKKLTASEIEKMLYDGTVTIPRNLEYFDKENIKVELVGGKNNPYNLPKIVSHIKAENAKGDIRVEIKEHDVVYDSRNRVISMKVEIVKND